MAHPSCWKAIAAVFVKPGEVLTKDQVISHLYTAYPEKPWKENTILLHLKGLSVNHPSNKNFPGLSKKAFLFSLGGGKYRRWNVAEDGVPTTAPSPGMEPLEAEPSDIPSEEGIDELDTAVDTSISLERDLERSLLADLSQLETGLSLFTADGVSGQQLDTGEVGRLDLLCVDKNDDLVVIELKAGRAESRVCGQILGYMGWVRENLAAGREVRGIVVANDFSESLKFAAKAMPNIALKKYAVRFEFTAA